MGVVEIMSSAELMVILTVIFILCWKVTKALYAKQIKRMAQNVMNSENEQTDFQN